MNHSAPRTTRRREGPRRLVLCFDGTGNHFQGNESDTNVVKIYEMLNRSEEDQFHYYQPGIGTFSVGEGGSAMGWFGRTKASISQALDEALGTSFEYHVCQGYEFLMKFYSPGDAIYVFGFSRGAYTARFLSEMISVVGLLSQGNEDLTRFAYRAFSQYQQARGKGKKTNKDVKHDIFLKKFKRTFCRPGVEVYFLGLFDCVNSVGHFEVPFRRSSFRYIATPPAKHIRHAVSIHERRLKFKPALFVFEKDHPESDIQEVWFAGNHCDVGGGFHYEGPVKHLLSDIPLTWMIDEVMALDDEPAGRLSFEITRICEDGHLKAGHADLTHLFGMPNNETNGTNGTSGTNGASASSVKAHHSRKARRHHDFLTYNGGASFFATSMWWFLEILPFFTRLELENGQWMPRYWPPNFGATRDLPIDAEVHPSVHQMFQVGALTKMPKLGGDEPPLLQDPMRPLRIFFRRLLLWKWIPKAFKKNKKRHSSRQPLRPNVTESDGAMSWRWAEEESHHD